MPEVRTDDAALHVEVDGDGEPVTVLAHGLTNSCRELAVFTPMVAGTKVRFCFRGHGHSSVPESGYGFADFARDLDAVADAYGARNAVGTSLGAAAICHLLGEDPVRFERIVLLLPAALDQVVGAGGFLRTASILESMPRERAIDTLLSDPGRVAKYREAPWLRELDLLLWKDMNAAGVAKALRGIVGDVAIRDRELLRKVDAPVLIIGREGDLIHPAEVSRVLADIFPNAELILLPGEEGLVASVPMLVDRIGSFLTGAG
ncbi:MAG: alpha/beta hydrolase [Actinobacteria bacterium]|nr:alpha/beta hydrolase [Actinomycetota bacterium]